LDDFLVTPWLENSSVLESRAFPESKEEKRERREKERRGEVEEG